MKIINNLSVILILAEEYDHVLWSQTRAQKMFVNSNSPMTLRKGTYLPQASDSSIIQVTALVKTILV